MEYGTIEPEARDAIWHAASNQSTLDLSDSYFVLLGAGSAMGPLLVLLSLGANVIAVDLDRPQIWRRLLLLASESTGRMIFPLKKELPETATREELAEHAGCNLFTQVHSHPARGLILFFFFCGEEKRKKECFSFQLSNSSGRGGAVSEGVFFLGGGDKVVSNLSYNICFTFIYPDGAW